MSTRPALVLAVLLCTGCSTVEGIGMDISASARAVAGWVGR